MSLFHPPSPLAPDLGRGTTLRAWTLVAAAFAQRRKTLRNALRALVTQEQIEACGIDPGARPEIVPPEAFNALASQLELSAQPR